MILDSSAVIAILLQEPASERVQTPLEDAVWAGIGTPTLVESALVLQSRMGPLGKTLLARFVQEADLVVVEFTVDHWTVAADAFGRYGKGRHPAGLNFGDCMTYATCKVADQPLLCIGDDFPRTDLDLVVPMDG